MKPVAIEANSRHLRLARRALKAAQTHLRNAVGLVSMPEDARERTRIDAIWLDTYIDRIRLLEVEANAHLSAQRKARGGR